MQNDVGLISIIMAAYNAEKTIEQAINSVLSQTYPDFELLVVNDCSTDKTAMLAEAIVKKDDRVRLISNEKNSGVSYTRKHGLEEASGEWVAILDSDDAWAPEKLEKQIKLQKKTNVMCSRGSVIPLFIDQIKAGNPITITDPNMTRFLMNLDEAVDLVMFAFQHGNPGDLFIQKSDASTIGDLAKAVQQLFGDTGTNIIGTRHGEKLFETLMTREERLRSEDMGHYFRVAADNRDLNYDKFVVKGEVHTMADESYTSHNTTRLDVEGTVKKIMTTEYVQNALKEDK